MARLALLALAFAAFSEPARAWDLFGHHVVGAIAWEELSPSSRLAVCSLLQTAPEDSDVPGLMPPGPRPLDARCRELFLKAQGWADLVRDEVWSKRKERYDHPEWHYVNHFWTPGPPPRALPERGTLGELSIRLAESISQVGNPSLATPERAVALLWVLHLSGDAHQPLHASGRVTAQEPKGDRGGNDFTLGDLESPNLHALWDAILRRGRRQSHGESYFRWVSRVAEELSSSHPKSALAREVGLESPDLWVKESASMAMSAGYPAYLERDAPIPDRYHAEVFAVAAKRAALAGYRLARLLERSFGAASEGAPDLLAHEVP